MDDLLRLVFERASAQRGLVTAQDLVDIGANRHARERLLRAGAITLLGRHTYVVGGLPPDPLRPVLLACLESRGVASHRTAAALHGLDGFELGNLPEVMVPRHLADHRIEGALVHATTWLSPDDIVAVDGVSTTGVPRTLLSLASLVPEVSFDRVTGAVDEAIRTGRARDPWLWWRLEKLRCRGRTGVSVLETILTIRKKGQVTESWLEREFLRILTEAGVPLPTCQKRIAVDGAFVARVDFAYDGTPILIEVTGAAAHGSAEQRARDARRRNKLGLLRPLLLEFTYEQVVHDPEGVVAQVLAALATAGRALPESA